MTLHDLKKNLNEGGRKAIIEQWIDQAFQCHGTAAVRMFNARRPLIAGGAIISFFELLTVINMATTM